MKHTLVVIGVMVTLINGVANAKIMSQNGIAKDSVTGLSWQDTTEASSVEHDWEGAKGYCSALTLGGEEHWRLPTMYELVTLVDSTKRGDPYLLNGITNSVSDHYWSASSHDNDTEYAFGVYFYTGNEGVYPKSATNYVRCVKGEPLDIEMLMRLHKKGKLKVALGVITNIIPEVK